MNISDWLESFKEHWIERDIDAVLNLFDESVEYWENPFLKLNSRQDLAKAWESILDQSDIKLETSLFASQGSTHAVLWNLEYKTSDNTTQYWSGSYLLSLNSSGKCTYFHQTGEQKI